MKKIIAPITFVLLVSLIVNSCTGDTGTSENDSQSSSLVLESTENSAETSNYTSSETSSETSETSDNTISGYLKKFKFITEDESKIDPKDNVSRSTALKIVMRLYNNENYALKTNWGADYNPKHTFTDIKSEEIDKYASCALHIGIIDDNGDHLFRGDENIKASEFVTWLLRALKYDDKLGHFDANEPWELSDLIGLTDGQYDSSQVLLFEDLLECSITALKTKMKNDSMGLYYYSFVYKRFDVEYPEVFQADDKSYIVIDKFDSFETINVGDIAGGRVMYSGDPNELLVSVLDPSVATFKFKENGNYDITALKEGQTTIKITSPGDSGERKEIGFINVVVISDMSAVINRCFDIIFAKNPVKTETELIEEFPEEFAAIVAFGEEAFPVLDEIIKESNSKGMYSKSVLAYYAKYTIKPELYDLVFISPNEKYAVKAVVDTFCTDYSVGTSYVIELINCETDSIILTINEMHTNISVKWSLNSRYVSISNGSRYFGITDVIDAHEIKRIKLPDEKIIERIVQEKFNNKYDIRSGPFYFGFDEWVDDSKIKIDVILINNIPAKEYEGWYIYDLVKNEIVEENIQKVKAD